MVVQTLSWTAAQWATGNPYGNDGNATLTSRRLNRDRQVRKVILIEGAANLLILALKTVVGLSTGSLAVLGDAVHSLTDVANNVVAWVVIRLSDQPPDREHPYGHRKFETLAVFGLASLLTVLAFELALHAVRREAPEIIRSDVGLALMIVVLAVNIALTTWQRRWAQRLNSDILMADASHTFADVLTTLVVIAGWQLSAAGYIWLDATCAIAVAGLVLYLAYGLFRRVIPILVDHIAVDPESVSAAVHGIIGVREVRRIRSRSMGRTSAVDLVVSVDPTLTTHESHAIADAVEELIETNFNVTDITVHIEPNLDALEGSRD